MSKPSILKVLFSALMVACWIGCADPDPVPNVASSVPTAAAHQRDVAVAESIEDRRDVFLGRWQGSYADVEDQLVIEKGEGPTGLTITLHSIFENPARVTGELIDANMIEIPKQIISGAEGIAVLTLHGDDLALRQSGLGFTFEGRYTKSETTQ